MFSVPSTVKTPAINATAPTTLASSPPPFVGFQEVTHVTFEAIVSTTQADIVMVLSSTFATPILPRCYLFPLWL